MVWASPYCDVLPTVKPIKINYCNLNYNFFHPKIIM